ncbi:NADH-quinone oxidoreductase subunit J [Rhodomicrobium lacus]|jgi:NADH-quinone oxidoreductase subunit J|uniref:NADH-quinone oxidoreductase subunit J n=1 Tax=Rhodomicrobium TaxID=1068 RepID=UPI0026E13280|nr:NADH-quinone oxidoreductase subunit J [Rhodomicrobium lacus]WKW49360.1 NADH-quinone oxidoreductase subunit J [Rhodomicrobium lacus]
MTIAGYFFYLFSIVLISSGAMVISARNPVHSVLFLILAFLNAAGLFVLLGAEFLAMILVIVYVGAVAVLFLFVVMTLDIDFVQLRKGMSRYLPIGILVGLVLVTELILVVGGFSVAPGAFRPVTGEHVTNTEAIGRVLYTDYLYFFQLSGLVLLVAMIGAIVLTLRHRSDSKRQNIARQVGRRREDAIEVVKVETGKGIS